MDQKERFMSNIACIRNSLLWLTGIPLLAACASDTVPLGGGELHPPLPAGSRCRESPVISESVHVSNQAALAALTGCEEIQGDLIIEVFAGADVSPLASLRAVGGDFQLGAYPGIDLEVIDEDQADELQRTFQLGLRNGGYLPSLAGLESLERTGNLQIAHISAPSLSVFANLRSVSSHSDASRAGQLVLEDNKGLVDFHGLENARGIRYLSLSDNPALEGLEGLVLGPALQNVNISGSPQLSELGPLAPIDSLSTLDLDNVGVRNLDDLQNLSGASGLGIADNPQLEQVDGLSGLVFADSLVFERNPKLLRLPAFAHAISIESFVATGNARLAAIALELQPPPKGPRLQQRPLLTGPRLFQIASNAQLQSISLAAGLTLAQHVAIYDNAALTDIDLGTLQNLDTLSVTDNASLSRVGLGDLQTVDALTVTGNPLLSTGEIEGVRTFDKTVARNAPAPAPVQ
jgi:Leucine-rich repeat (LRR) protein